MDNREFAKVLLCEATELLNEGARWNKELSKRAGEKSTIQSGRELAKEFAKARNSKNAMEKALLYKKIDAANTAITNSNTNKESNNTALRLLSNDSYIKRHGNKDKAEDWLNLHGNINDNAKYPACAKQQRLNRYRDKKAQNESIAILLTEAALLLNKED